VKNRVYGYGELDILAFLVWLDRAGRIYDEKIYC
jgi:hypothetical protein